MFAVKHIPAYNCTLFNYSLPYEDIFGGVVALTSQHFKLVNGFSNLFFGWGGEDDDFRNRYASLCTVHRCTVLDAHQH